MKGPRSLLAFQVCIIEEGAASPLACLGLVRLVAHLAQCWAVSTQAVTIVTDCGTGTTAIGGCLSLLFQACYDWCASTTGHELLMQISARMIMTTLDLLIQLAMWVCAGLAIGVALLDLPWKVQGVMLAGSAEYYVQQQFKLAEAFSSDFLTGKLLHFQQDTACPWQLQVLLVDVSAIDALAI